MLDSIRRADRALGRLVWGTVGLGLLAAAGFAAYAGVMGFIQTEGGERWAVLALAGSASALCLAFARQAFRKRRLSEVLDES